MDGEELCRQLRADGRTADIPIVVVTARVGDEERVRCLEAGADAYLAKPFRREELLAHAARLFKRRKEAQRDGGKVCLYVGKHEMERGRL